MTAGNPCYTDLPPSLPERTSPIANQFIKAVQGVVPPIIPPEPGEQVRITVGNCYGPESPLPASGGGSGNVLFPRPRQGVPEEPPEPANPIQITVGNCYIPGAPPRNIVPTPAGDPAVSNPTPKIGNVTAPPPAQPGDLVRAIVSNCYGPEVTPTLEPDPGPYYTKPRNEIELPPTPPNGADVIRQLVDNCYGPVIPLTPTPPDGPWFPPDRQGEPDPAPEDDPGQIIRDIVERCYPSITPTPTPDPTPDGPEPQPLWPDPHPWDWLCQLFPSLEICDKLPEIVPPPDIFPFDPIPTQGYDCVEVIKGLNEKPPTVKQFDYPKRTDRYKYISGPFKGKILICDRRTQPPEPPDGPEKCVKQFLDCHFKPYATGTYKMPPVSCDTFYFRGQNSISKQICVKNCWPKRIPVYEYLTGDAGRNVMMTPVTNPMDGTNSGGFRKHNLRVVTTDVAGNYKGGRVFCVAGNKFFNSESVQSYSASLGGATVDFSCRGVRDGNEYDSEWWVTGFSGNLPSLGTTSTYSFNAGKLDCRVRFEVIKGASPNGDHSYGLEPTKSGYVTTNDGEPAFWILENPVKGAVPIYSLYSDQLKDTFLTTNPGAPASRGPGERAFIRENGYGDARLLGFVFRNKDLSSGYIFEGEEIQELHRYFNGRYTDIDGEWTSSGNIDVTGTGTGKLSVAVKWDDSRADDGRPFETISAQGQTIVRRGEKGAGSFEFDATGGQTIDVDFTGLGGEGMDRRNGDRTLTLGDDDSENNAFLTISAINGGYSPMSDHKYSIQKLHRGETAPRYHPRRLSYKIPSDPDTPFVITYKIKKGSAGYENTWGAAITNEDGDEIYWAQVIEQNTTRDVETTQYDIPIDVLEDNVGREIVFFLIPDGNGGGAPGNGSNISFGTSGDHYTHSSSTEGNKVFFSNNKMNAGNRNKVKFHGNHEQWWEDLDGSDSDEDYDDFKLTYRVRYAGSDWEYQGIEGYVYATGAPDPIMVDIVVRQQCAEPLLSGIFVDAMLMRSECGRRTRATKQNRTSYSVSGKCSGEYTHQIHSKQTLKVRRSANLSLRAFGSLIRSPESEEFEFKWTLKRRRNGSTTTLIDWDDRIKNWPEVGYNFGDFDVNKNDLLIWEVSDIDRGPETGVVTVSFAVFDRDDNVFEKPWELDIGSSPITGEAEGRTEVTSNLPRIGNQTGSNITTGGRIKKLSIRLWDKPRKAWSRKVTVWDNGAKLDTNGLNGQDASWNDVYYDGSEHQCGQGFYEGLGSNRFGHILSTHVDSKGRITGKPNVRNQRGIYYNSLFEHGRGMIVKPSNSIGNILAKYSHLSNAEGYVGWFINIDAPSCAEFSPAITSIDEYYAKGITGGYVPQNFGQYSKMSFMHDYNLGEYDDKRKVTEETPSAKIRLAFWPYTVMGSHTNSAATYSEYGLYWGCAVELFDLLDRGAAYQQNQTFDLVWPPEQPQDYNNANNDTNDSTPYWPRDDNSGVKLPSRITVDTVGTDPNDRYSREFAPKQAIYQESHNRDSNVWYFCQTDKKMDRIKIRIEVEEVE